MLRFESDLDKKGLALSLGYKTYESVPADILEDFLKQRKSLVKKIVDFRRSNRTKRQWVGKRFTMMKGIKRFHRSTAGKRFHRALSRFLLTRISNKDSEQTRSEALASLSSFKTHLYIEARLYTELIEQADFQEFLDDVIPSLTEIEKTIYKDKSLSEEQLDLLFRIVDRGELAKVLKDNFRTLAGLSRVDYESPEELGVIKQIRLLS